MFGLEVWISIRETSEVEAICDGETLGLPLGASDFLAASNCLEVGSNTIIGRFDLGVLDARLDFDGRSFVCSGNATFCSWLLAVLPAM